MAYAPLTKSKLAKTSRTFSPRQKVRRKKWKLCGETVKLLQLLNIYTKGFTDTLPNRTDIHNMDQKTVLSQLPVAEGASFDSHAEEYNPTCLPNTRVELLNEISQWVDDLDAKAIFWLNGMAGTGKSTISRTIACSLSRKDRLGASFFFKRGETDRGGLSKFFTTVARQLIIRLPSLAPLIKDAIEADPNRFGTAVREQFKKLIIEPLSKIQQAALGDTSLVIIIDALDECEKDDDIRLIINLFSSAQVSNSLRLKIFVTSRPDLPIRLGFSTIKGTYRDFILHEIPPPVIEHDISEFLKHELGTIRDDYNTSVSKERNLPPIWPGCSDIQALVRMAVPLFIFAATACRFISDRRCGDPDEQLREVLRTGNQESQLDATYLPTLNKFVAGLSPRKREQLLRQFRGIVGSIAILASPLSISALGQLLDIPMRTIDNQLDSLHSVLSIPSSPNAPVRLLHLSFRDFLVDREKCGKSPFWIDEEQAHKEIAANCLRIMDRLKQDICSIKSPGTPRSAVEPQKIDAFLPSEVQYACLYWVYHTQKAAIHLADGGQVYGFLIHHFLHWIEALSLIGRLSESLGLIKALQSLLQVSYIAYIWWLYRLVNSDSSLKAANSLWTSLMTLHVLSLLTFQSSIPHLSSSIPLYLPLHLKGARCGLVSRARLHHG